MADNCEIKRIKKVKLCIGDLRHLVEIQLRELGSVAFGDTQPSITFTKLRDQKCAIETIKGVGQGVSRFAKINIEDGATHLFWCMYDTGFPALENSNHFLSYDDKRYKVLRVDNINERNSVLVIQTTERGEDSEEASEA